MSTTQVNNTLSQPAEGVVDPRNAKANKARQRKQNFPLIFFAGPAVILYVIFFLFPGVNSLRLSVFEWNLFDYKPREFNGIDNYVRLATDDIIFREALGNNLELMLWVVLFQGGLSLLLAMMLIKNSRTNVLLRAIYFFPTILSSVSVGLIWSFMFESNLGVINTVLNRIGLPQFTANWLGDENIALYSIAITQVWFHTGQMMVIYVAGLQQIPAELYESAKIDGATGFQIFRKITWPLIVPTGFVVIAYTTIQSFRAFDLIYTMTGGGPNYSTEILATRIYSLGLLEGRYGYAAAQSVFFMVTIALITFLQRRLLRTRT